MFGYNRRVEEDLERIRKANLPPERLANEIASEQNARDKLESITKKEIFSMIIAAWSIVFPYLTVFAAFLLLFWLAIRLWAGVTG